MKENGFIPQLTGIRAIAAFSVFIYHFNLPNTKSIFFPFFNELHIGVDIFFVLSGFLIAYRYKYSYELTRKWISQYIVNRVARIYPIYFLLTLFTFAVGYVLAITTPSAFTSFQIFRHTLFEFLMNISFLKGFFNDLKFTGIPQGWTLTVEECFYFSAPLIFVFAKKIGLWIQPIILLALGFVIVKLFGTTNYFGFFSNNWFMITFTIFGKAFEFFLGIYLAKSLYKNDFRFFKIKNITYVASFLIIAFIITIAVSKQIVNGYYYKLLYNFVFPIFICWLLFGLIKEKTLLSKLLSTKLFVLLGKSSYVFYLIHLGVIQMFISGNISESFWVNFLILNMLAILIL